MITVKQLKELLEKFPQDLPVGVVGHYGEFLEITPEDFYIQIAHLEAPRSAEFRVLHMAAPDAGEAPD